MRITRDLDISDFDYVLHTQRGNIKVHLGFGSDNGWLLYVSGILESWMLPDYDEDEEANILGPCERWQALGWLADCAEHRGARVLSIQTVELLPTIPEEVNP